MKVVRIISRNIRDAFKSVFRNFALSLASIVCIVITLIVVSISIVLSYNVNNFTTLVEKDLTIVAFLETNISLERALKIEDEINVLNDVENIVFREKMEIAAEMIATSPDYKVVLEKYKTREENPLCDTYQVKVTNVHSMDKVAEEIGKIENVKSVKYGEGMIDQLISTFNAIKNISIGVVAALILVTAFLIANTIKITIFSRKREIEIMRLVGASNINIKIPFVLEGLFLGLLGSIIPIVATIFGYNALYEKFSKQLISPFIQLIAPIPFVYNLSFILLGIGIVVGMVGSWQAVRKYLKI